VATLSTESIASPQPPAGGTGAPSCPSCGSPLGADQRYCLECGERQAPVSEFLRSGGPVSSSPPVTPPRPPGAPPGSAQQGPRNNNTVSLLAGVGVLLLALGVGVLIGRSGSGKSSGAPIVVTQGAAAAPGPAASTEASFTADWPSGTSGYTVQLETLPASGTSTAAVIAAKTAAGKKGATGVGALKSEEFASLEGENYVIYSGVYPKHAEAEKALASLKKTFPGAKVIHVSKSSSSSSSSSSSKGGSSGTQGGSKPSVPSSLSKPASSNALPSHHASGKKFEEESAKLPDVVETG
jgi:hypothetical protein